MILSVHIGKTGGSSFKKILIGVFGDRLYLDYTKKTKRKYFVYKVRNIYRKIIRKKFTVPEGIEIIHGHIQSTKYDYSFNNIKYITWLREPSQRVLSHYYYWKRSPDLTNMVCVELMRKGFCIEDFIKNRMTRNVQSRFLNGKKVTDFTFIGITDQYDRSMCLFQKMFGIENNIMIDKINVNEKNQGDKYELTPALKNKIMSLNRKDYGLCAEGLEYFEKSVKNGACDRV